MLSAEDVKLLMINKHTINNIKIMKIIKIEESVNPMSPFNVFSVMFKPNWLERVFGAITHTKQYKDTGEKYLIGGGHVYITKDGEELGNSNWIGKKSTNTGEVGNET